MAKVTLVEVPNLAPLLKIDAGVNASLVKASATPAVAYLIGKMQPVAQAHHSNLLDEIQLKLNGVGMPLNVHVGGVRRLGVGLVTGGIGGVTTKYWWPLSKRYAGRSPVSLSFWHKADKLAPAFREMAAVVRRKKVSVQELKAKRNHHKGKINTSILLSFPSLRFPFEKGVSIPFLTGDQHTDMRDIYPVHRSGLGRARFAEQNDTHPTRERPFLRLVSAYLGQQMFNDIKSKLRKI